MRYEISPNVVSTEVDDHVVLLNIESQEFYTIDLLARGCYGLHSTLRMGRTWFHMSITKAIR